MCCRVRLDRSQFTVLLLSSLLISLMDSIGGLPADACNESGDLWDDELIAYGVDFVDGQVPGLAVVMLAGGPISWESNRARDSWGRLTRKEHSEETQQIYLDHRGDSRSRRRLGRLKSTQRETLLK